MCKFSTDLDELGRTVVRSVHDIVNVIAHGHKKIEKQLASTNLHLHLHGSAALESLTTSDNQGQKVRAQFGILVRCIVVRKPS